uniref:Methyltransferase domain-containing protein n=1 Tax=Alexandrium monilatum TaxID=311494 RepID=A0A7S4SMC6_9DINO
MAAPPALRTASWRPPALLCSLLLFGHLALRACGPCRRSAAFSAPAPKRPYALRHLGQSWPRPPRLSHSGLPLPCRATRVAVPVAEDTSAQQLKTGIASYYDGLTPLWMDVWGEHLHHGFYGPRPSGAEPSYTGKGSLDEHRAAQVAMIDEVLAWARSAEDAEPRKILDVGCGVGGASRHLATAFPGASATGITLSPVQARTANTLSASEGLDSRTAFKVQDALAMPPNWTDSHDLVWSLESGEHMPDKPKFVSELARVTAPGGRAVVVTWVHRDLRPGEKKLRSWERTLLRLISSCYYLPEWTSAAEYERLCAASGLADVRRADWTDAIAPFWPAVIRSASRPRNFFRLLGTGVDGVRSAVAMFLMVLGYRMGLIKFGLLTARKPLRLAAAAGVDPPPSMVAATLVGERRLLPREEEASLSQESLAGDSRPSFLSALHRFSRPHTVRGTLIASLAAVVRAVQTSGGLPGGVGLVGAKIGGLVLSLLCANTVCVGVNQIYDVKVDRINKPFLPIASGEMSVSRAWGLASAALVVGVGLATSLFSPPLAAMYAAGLVLGSAYSVPPFRFRRFPLAALLIISCVRGCMLNFWVYHAVKEVLSLPFQWDPVVFFLTRFMTVFAAMIAVTKDLADVKGDVAGKIETFAASFGARSTATAAACVMALNYLSAIAEGLWRGARVFNVPAMVGGHFAALAYLLWSRWRLSQRRGEGADRFYMRIWDLFYFEYILYLFL